MAESSKTLGKLVSIHGVSPIHMQRAAIVAVLAFIFFLAMLMVFSIRRHFGYLILASAFIVVEIFTLLGLFSHRRNVLRVFENGLCYKKQCCRWSEIGALTPEKGGLKITTKDGGEIILPNTLQDFEKAAQHIGRTGSAQNNK